MQIIKFHAKLLIIFVIIVLFFNSFLSFSDKTILKKTQIIEY